MACRSCSDVRSETAVKLSVLENGRVPIKTTEGSAGYDVYTARRTTLAPGGVIKVPLGIKLSLPDHLFAKLVGRSSTPFKGVQCITGIIDSDFRGELHATLYNFSDVPVVIDKGERVAQLVFADRREVRFERVYGCLDETRRDQHGYGSTGDC